MLWDRGEKSKIDAARFEQGGSWHAVEPHCQVSMLKHSGHDSNACDGFNAYLVADELFFWIGRTRVKQ